MRESWLDALMKRKKKDKKKKDRKRESRDHL